MCFDGRRPLDSVDRVLWRSDDAQCLLNASLVGSNPEIQADFWVFPGVGHADPNLGVTVGLGLTRRSKSAAVRSSGRRQVSLAECQSGEPPKDLGRRGPIPGR
jgi:hypothetical protein